MGRDPDPAKFEKFCLTGEARKVADKVEGKLIAETVKYLEKGLVEVGGTAIGAIIKAKNSTWIGLGVDILKDWLVTALQTYARARLLQRYEIDERRRPYLAVEGESQYRRVDLPAYDRRYPRAK